MEEMQLDTHTRSCQGCVADKQTQHELKSNDSAPVDLTLTRRSSICFRTSFQKGVPAQEHKFQPRRQELRLITKRMTCPCTSPQKEME